MYIVGLTGGIGSGKSAASDIFEQLGITVVDADLVAREVVVQGSPALVEIAHHFGLDILLPDGNLNRARLREIVFNHPDEKAWLEELLHPIIRSQIIQQLNASRSRYTILSSPLLIETDQHKLVHRVLLIDIPESLQIARTTQRDNVASEQVEKIMATQAKRDYKKGKADDIIVNDRDMAHLQDEVSRYHQIYLQQAVAHEPS